MCEIMLDSEPVPDAAPRISRIPAIDYEQPHSVFFLTPQARLGPNVPLIGQSQMLVSQPGGHPATRGPLQKA
jgi:hypothetical protein